MDGDMWPSEVLAEYLRRRSGGSTDPWTEVVWPGARTAVLQGLRAARGAMRKRGRGFEWLGVDLMLSEDLRVRCHRTRNLVIFIDSNSRRERTAFP